MNGERTFKRPAVEVVFDGINYVVIFRDCTGSPTKLREFDESYAARCYRDGVAEGIFQTSFLLNQIVGAGS